MTDHIQIRDRREEVLNQYEGIQVGRNGILGDYINSIASINTWLEFLNETLIKEKFNEYLTYLQSLLNEVETYEDWGLFHRRLGTLEGNSIYETPELCSIFFESDDVKPIIEAININVHELRQIGGLLENMTQKEWGDQGKEISKWITMLVEKQNKLIKLGIQDEVVESVDDVQTQVFNIMHVENAEFLEGNNMGSEIHLICDEPLSNAMLEKFGIIVGDTIARELGDDTVEYTVKGVGYHKSHLPYSPNREGIEANFRNALLSGDVSQITLCFTEENKPDNFHMIELSRVTSVQGTLIIDQDSYTYEII